MESQKDKQEYKKVKLGLRFIQLTIPELWTVTNVGTFVYDVKGGAPLTPNDFAEKGFSVLHKGDIKQNNVLEIGETNPFCSMLFAEEHKSSIIDDSFLVVTLRDLVPSGPAIGLIAQSNGDYLLAQGAYGFHYDEKKIDSRYLVHLSNTDFYRKYMRSISVGSTQIHIRSPEFLKIQLPLPPLPEQQKIASILSNVDSLINLTQKEIDQTQRLKKGLMQKLLTRGIGHTKFKKVPWLFGKEIEIPEEWDLENLTNLDVKTSSGGTPSRENSDYYTGKNLWIKSGELKDQFLSNSEEKITDNAIENSSAKIFPKNTVLVAMYGVTIGKTAILEEVATTNQAICGILPNKKFNPVFLQQFLIQKRNILVSFGMGGGQPNISQEVIKNFKYLVPTLKEQQKIASILSNIDTRIESQTQYKEKLERLKKSLMQKLLTGQIRVKI